ncbi:uncharacterized protein LOC133780141 [Humulus lupulus]|uniref:uncharacterized protein LOC133780141 n=1 Tax=Humulus lupulus TaxID=3486 RepID=UPI002B40A0A6|nr:uncharacterized protein LOC133780141 [Humulus lupulus]
MKQRANRCRSRLQSSLVADVLVSPSPKVAVSSSIDASVPSAVVTTSSRVVSPALESSVAMAIILVLPTVVESSPSPSLPEVVTGSLSTVSSSDKVLHAHPPSSVGKSSKRITRSSAESASSPVPSSPLPASTKPSSPSLKSPIKPSLPKTPKARSVSKPAPSPQSAPPPQPAPPPKPVPPPQPQPKPSPQLKPAPHSQSTPTPPPKTHPTPLPKSHAPVRSKGKAQMHESSPLPKPSAPKRKPKETPVAPSPKNSKLSTSSKDSVFVNPSSIQYFVDATKVSHYQRWLAVREVWPEYLVVLEDFPELVALLQNRQWVNTVSKLMSPHPILVREFYANLDKSVVDGKNENCLTAFVRGCRIKFAPSTISRALKIPKVLKPAYNKSYRPDQSTMGHVLTGQPDYVWGNHEIPVTKLTPFYRILHRVALYNWFPNSHLSSITLEIGKCLYDVGTGVSIDLATLIFDRIVDVASSTGTRNKFPFPSLIQQIIQSAKPLLTIHDFQVPSPMLSKGFLATLKRKVSTTAPSSSQQSKPQAPMFRGLSDSSWQVQMYTEFKAFTTQYKKDQNRQKAFEASVYKLLHVVKDLGEFNTPVASPVPPVSSLVPPADAVLDQSVAPMLHDTSDKAPDSTAPIQGEK